MKKRYINSGVQRKLYAESMGRCMNPKCKVELFQEVDDISEKAHIEPFAETADNSFENLIILCPNCHTKFDKNLEFTQKEIKEWKEIRKNELNSFFSEKYVTFDELSRKITPLLLENKQIYENYYIGQDKKLWDKFEYKMLSNNEKLKNMLENNLHLIQNNIKKEYSNLELIYTFIAHINEFKKSRLDEEKTRKILFPEKINSMFGITPVNDSLIPSTESLEALITAMKKNNEFCNICLGNDEPYIESKLKGKIFLKDQPRLRQLYFDYDSFRGTTVRLDSLNQALKYINSQNVIFTFYDYNNLREIKVGNKKIVFVYEYCLSKVFLERLCPQNNIVIVNLHSWNGESCISREAYNFAEKINVVLLSMEKFYGYIKKNKL